MLRGHWTFLFENFLFLWDIFFSHKIKYHLKGHTRSHEALLSKFFLAYSFFNLRRGCVFFKVFMCSHLITTLTYVLTDDFYPCFLKDYITGELQVEKFSKQCVKSVVFFGYASIPIVLTFFAWWYILADNFL